MDRAAERISARGPRIVRGTARRSAPRRGHRARARSRSVGWRRVRASFGANGSDSAYSLQRRGVRLRLGKHRRSTDFSDTSMRAARLALALAAPDAELLLTHVKTPAGRVATANALRRQAEALQTGFCGRVKPVDLEGDAATELLAFANSNGVDAIAVGTHGQAWPSRGARGTLGTVATRIVRCSACSLIVAPGVQEWRERSDAEQ